MISFWFGGDQGADPSPLDGGALITQNAIHLITESGNTLITEYAPVNPLLAQSGSTLITESGNTLIEE